MRQLWLEKLAEDGLIRKEAVAHIYKEVEDFMKEANEQVGGLTRDKLLKHFSNLLGAGITAGVFFGGKHALNKLQEKRQAAEGRDMITKARESVLKQYKDAEELEKAQARFDEIARYSPHVAMNAPLVSKLVRSNLHSGISDETAQRLAMVQASYLNNLKQQQAMIPGLKTASIRAEALGEILADAYVLQKTAVSRADVGKFMRTVGFYSAIPLVSGAVTGLAQAGWAKLKERDLKKSLDESFQTAVRQAPETHQTIFKQDMAKTRQAFDALAHFAPSVAMQPHAARTFMKKMLDYYEQGGMNVTDVKELTEIQKNISGSSKPSPFGKGFETGSRFVSSGPMSKGIEAATSGLMTVPEMANG